MHVVTGGAYNGKTDWIKRHYRMTVDSNVVWHSAYRGDAYPGQLIDWQADVLVLSGVELWLKDWLDVNGLDRIRIYGRQLIDTWLEWEKAGTNRQLIVVGSDMSKGIVPMEVEMRTYRDASGWFFQDLVAKCARFDLIWYGINQQLK